MRSFDPPRHVDRGPYDSGAGFVNAAAVARPESPVLRVLAINGSLFLHHETCGGCAAATRSTIPRPGSGSLFVGGSDLGIDVGGNRREDAVSGSSPSSGEGQSSGGTTVTMPNSRKCLSKAKAVVMPSRCITTRLTQSVKLHSLS